MLRRILNQPELDDLPERASDCPDCLRSHLTINTAEVHLLSSTKIHTISSNTFILVLGAGELGISVLQAISSHPQIINNKSHISVLLRSASPTTPAKRKQLSIISSLNVSILTADIASSSLSQLIAIFNQYHTIISCTGFAAPPGTQVKTAQAILNARVRWHIPWQFRLDYDAIGRGSGQDLFDEQLDVRDLLRREENAETEWIIFSTGLFMSFQFNPDFVVDLQRRKVTALGSWNHTVTVTDVTDIGAITARVSHLRSGRSRMRWSTPLERRSHMGGWRRLWRKRLVRRWRENWSLCQCSRRYWKRTQSMGWRSIGSCSPRE